MPPPGVNCIPDSAIRIGQSIQPFLTCILAIRSKQASWIFSTVQSESESASSTGIRAVSASFEVSGLVFIFLLV